MRNTQKKYVIALLILIAILFIPLIVFADAVNYTTIEGVESDVYAFVDDYIMRVEAKDTVKTFLENLRISDGVSCKVYNGTNEVAETEFVATGMSLKVGEKSYKIAVRGDLNGDGEITATDLSLIKLHAAKITELKDAPLKAADINYDNRITVTDRAQIKMLISGMSVSTDKAIIIPGYITMSPSTTERTQSVTVTVTWPVNGIDHLIKQISIDGGKTFTTYTKPVAATSNTPVVARLINTEDTVIKTQILNINNVDNVAPKDFELAATSTENSITINGQTTDTANPDATSGIEGILGYQYRIDNNDWSELTTDTTYTFNNLTQATEYHVYMKAVDKTGNEKIATNAVPNGFAILTKTILDGESHIAVSLSETQPTKNDIIISMTTDTDYDMQYQIGSTEGNWLPYNGEDLVIDHNCIVYVRLVDSTGQGGEPKRIVIGNIDRIAPNDFPINLTSRIDSITVNAEVIDTADDGAIEGTAGIAGYQYKIDDCEWSKTIIDPTYTFIGLIPNTKHTVYMKAIDKAGNEKIISDVETIGYRVSEVGTDKLKLLAKPANPVNGNVRIVMTTDVKEYNIEYQIGEVVPGAWIPYTQGNEGVQVDSNCIVYARTMQDGVQQWSTLSIKITNIDRIAPNAFDLRATSTSNSITVSAASIVTDTADADYTEETAGIIGYQYKIDDGAWTDVKADSTYTFTDLLENTTHTVYMKARDKAGNETIATNSGYSVTTLTRTEN